MELPFTIVFEPPSNAELRALLRMRGYWAAGLIVALAIGTAYLLAGVARADTTAAQNPVSLALSSEPAGATVWIDGHPRGSTPVLLPVDAGQHDVLLKTSQTIDAQYALNVGAEGAAFNAVLWRHQPRVTHLRPALPGAQLADVRVLDNGDLALSVALPPGRDMEAWRLDPRTGQLTSVAEDIAATRLAFASDGLHLAYIGSEVGPSPRQAGGLYTAGGGPLTVLWLIEPDDGAPHQATGWRPQLDPDEQLVDVSWSPGARRLLAVSSEPLGASARRSRLWFLDADGQRARQAVSLPSDVVPGTEAWSPDGQHVTFVAHAAQVNALCLLGLDGTFRYVADLDSSAEPPPGFPSATWAADGQHLMFVAPHQHQPGVAFDWLQPDAPHAVFLDAVNEPIPSVLADTLATEVTWREDGQVIGLWRPGSDNPLSVRLLNGSSGSGQELVQLPVKPGTEYAAIWDLPRADLLVLGRARGDAMANDYWLARLGLEAEP